MRITSRIFLGVALAAAIGLALFTGCKTGSARKSARSRKSSTSREAGAIGIDAYIYGYPLVTMEMTRRVMTNVREPEGRHGPMGQFAHVRTYPAASNQAVTAPNADTLYTSSGSMCPKSPR